MAKIDRIKRHTSVAPPALAERLLIALSAREYRDDVLGDLHEQFNARRQLSSGQARRWYWHQALMASPSLLVRRLQLLGLDRLLIIIFACMAALVAIQLWDTLVARRTVLLLASQTDAPGLIIIRSIYFLVFTLGAGLAGAMAAYIAFKPEHSFSGQLKTILLPVFLIATTAMAGRLIVTGTDNWLNYLLIRSVLMAPALILGAYLTGKVRQRWH